MIKQCEECGEQFTARSVRYRYCSASCRQRVKLRTSARANKEKTDARHKKYIRLPNGIEYRRDIMGYECS